MAWTLVKEDESCSPITINDLELGESNEVARFSDDIRLCKDFDEFQDLCILGEWAVKWQMLLNVSKCKAMNIGAKKFLISHIITGV